MVYKLTQIVINLTKKSVKMKKMILLVLALALVFSVSSFAEKKMVEVDDGTTAGAGPTADNIVSINALSYLIGFFNVSYERKIMDYTSIRVRAMDWALISTISSGAGNFFGFGGDVFIYPMGKACTGWFVGPRYDAFFLTIKTSTEDGNWMIMMLGASAGYRWVWQGGFEMGIGFGAWANISSTWKSSSGGISKGATLLVLRSEETHV